MSVPHYCFPYSGFYAFDDSSETEEFLLNCCKNVTVSGYNEIKNNSDLFTILHVNCRSIMNKDTELELLLSSLNNKPRICLFTETWLSENLLAPNFINYSGHHMCRDGRIGGGVSIYVHNDLQGHEIKCSNMSTFEYNGVIVKIDESMSVLAICIYRPPSTDVHIFLDELDQLFVSVANDYPHIDKLIVGGDFNINLLDNVKNADSFMDLLTSHSLYPSIFKPTRPSSNALLDNIFLSWPTLADSFVLMYDVSDHYPIIARLFNAVTSDSCVNKKKYVRVHSDANMNSFRTKLSACKWDNVYNASDVNVAYNELHTAVSTSYHSAFPLQLCNSDARKKHIKPWMTRGLLLSAKNRSRLYRDYLKGKVSKENYNRYRNLFVKLSRCAKRAYYSDFFQKNRRNVREVW